MYLKTYNLEKTTLQIIKKLVEEYPDKTKTFYAQKLGISERTLFRYIKTYELESIFHNSKISRAINLLSERGYKINRNVRNLD